MNLNPNNYAFIDSQNLNLGIKSQGWTLDFAKFRIFLKDKYGVSKAFLFIGYVPTNQTLYTDLQKFGYICIFKPTQQIKQNGKLKIKGNVDAELVLHAMIEFQNYEKGDIVSGDGDFYCLADHLATKGKLEKIIVPNSHYSSLLKKHAPYIVSVQLFKNKVEK